MDRATNEEDGGTVADTSLSWQVQRLSDWHHERYGGSTRPSHKRFVETALLLTLLELEELRKLGAGSRD